MSNYMSEVRHHEKEIQRLNSAGSENYRVARYHLDEIGEIMKRVSKSKNNKGNISIIHDIYKSLQILVDKMKLSADY